MGENEKRFVALIVEFEERLTSVREHIKANFSIGSEFDKEKASSICSPLQIVQKEHIECSKIRQPNHGRLHYIQSSTTRIRESILGITTINHTIMKRYTFYKHAYMHRGKHDKLL